MQDKKNELNNLQNGGSTYNDNEGVVENVAHMDHNSHDYQRMFGPLYVTPDNDKNAVDENDPLMQTLDEGFSSNLRKHDLINNNQPTEAQYKEVCEALMAEINATREARGLQPFVMTDQMFNAAMERASQPSAQGENKWHDANGISKAFEDNGIDFDSFKGECLAEYANLINPMKDVADLIYSDSYLDLYEMLDDDADSNWGHRGVLLGDYNNQPVQASFGLQWVPEDGDYNLVFDVANYNGDGSDNLMNQVKDWENQPANNNEAQIESLKNDINNLQNDLNNLNNQKQSLQDKINDLNNQMNNVKFDENQLSPSDKQAYDDAQNTLNTVDQWQQSQINSINNNSNVDALNKKANDDKAALDKLNNQIAQTKQEINDLENQLNALNNQPSTPTENQPAEKPSTNTPAENQPTEKPSTSTPAENQPTEKPSTSTPAESQPAEKPSTSTDNKTDDVLPGPDQIVVVPTVSSNSSENENSDASAADNVVANISYDKGIDPLTNRLLSDETPAQRQKAKNYVESLNKTVNVKENKVSEKPVYNQPITFTFSEDTVKADNVKDNAEAKNELPTTGENQDKAATVLGIEAVSMGLALGGLSFLKRKKNN